MAQQMHIDLIKRSDVATILNVPVDTLIEWRRKGQGPVPVWFDYAMWYRSRDVDVTNAWGLAERRVLNYDLAKAITEAEAKHKARRLESVPHVEPASRIKYGTFIVQEVVSA